MHLSRLAARSLFLTTILGGLLGLASCSSAPTTQSVNQQIYVADQAVTSIVGSTDAALNAHLISKAEAQSVSTIAHQVAPLLDSARVAVSSNDIPGATKTLALVNSLLKGLQAYVPPPGSLPPIHADNR